MRFTPEYKARDAAGYQRHYHNNRYDDWHDFTGLFAVVAGTIAVVGHACTSWHAIVRGRDSCRRNGTGGTGIRSGYRAARHLAAGHWTVRTGNARLRNIRLRRIRPRYARLRLRHTRLRNPARCHYRSVRRYRGSAPRAEHHIVRNRIAALCTSFHSSSPPLSASSLRFFSAFYCRREITNVSSASVKSPPDAAYSHPPLASSRPPTAVPLAE